MPGALSRMLEEHEMTHRSLKNGASLRFARPGRFLAGLAGLAGLSGLAGCDGGQASDLQGEGRGVTYQHVGSAPTLQGLPDYNYNPSGTGLSSGALSPGALDTSLNYGMALRTASIKLTGQLPSMADIRRLQAAAKVNASDGSANDPMAVYKQIVQGYLNDKVSFNRQMVQFWRNTLRMGGTLTGLFQDMADADANRRQVSLETGPAFAARLIDENKDMRQLFTQASNTCPTFNATTGTFTDGACFVANVNVASPPAMPGNNIPEGQQAGILTNPGLLAQYYSNFGFRRARLINELFACTRYPAEFRPQPLQVGSYLYSSPWDPNSISADADGQRPVFDLVNQPRMIRGGTKAATNEFVNFTMDCRSCHTSLNHRAPMFAVFDQVGFRHPTNKFMVTSTATGSPFAQIQEYLFQCNPDPKAPVTNPLCQKALAWRFEGARFDSGGTQVPDFQGFGKEMAADPQIAKCMMIRAWNYAYSRDDVVNELALVPDSVIQDLTGYFVQQGYNYKAALLRLYTDPNFIRF